MSFNTADLCDSHPDSVEIADPLFSDFGGRETFHGMISTVKVFEDNSLVRQALEQPGQSRVLVVDGGGSLRCALLGDQLGALALENGWAGIVINGCVRDSAELMELDLGVRALATHPLKSVKRGEGRRDVVVRFAGVHFVPGHYLYADADGVLCSPVELV
jgi:regulator of ribonuclease activity A